LQEEFIIYILICNLIPNCINNNRLKLASLYEKIGKDLIKANFNQEWVKYNKNIESYLFTYKLDDDLDNSKFNTKTFEKGLNKDEFIKILKGLVAELSNDDFFKLGSDLSEFIANKTDLFKLINKKNLDNTVNRILLPDKGLDEKILKIITLDSEVLPMVCLPVKWGIQIKNDKS
jgi:hypothetical protein